MPKKKILITGANGRIGKLLQEAFAEDYELRLADIQVCKTTYTQDVYIVDIVNSTPESLSKLMQGVDCIIHLAAIADEIADADKILYTNIQGTKNVLEAAKIANVSRFILASSIHTVGFYPRSKVLFRDTPPRPSGFYGISKVACEALVSLYADKYGLSGICLRINTLETHPNDTRELITWLSESDAINLFRAAIEASSDIHFDIVYGVSNNTNKKLSNIGSSVLFKPQDNAEMYRTQIEKSDKKEGPIAKHFHGGPFTERNFNGNLSKTLNQQLSVSNIKAKL